MASGCKGKAALGSLSDCVSDFMAVGSLSESVIDTKVVSRLEDAKVGG